MADAFGDYLAPERKSPLAESMATSSSVLGRYLAIRGSGVVPADAAYDHVQECALPRQSTQILVIGDPNVPARRGRVDVVSLDAGKLVAQQGRQHGRPGP